LRLLLERENATPTSEEDNGTVAPGRDIRRERERTVRGKVGHPQTARNNQKLNGVK